MDAPRWRRRCDLTRAIPIAPRHSPHSVRMFRDYVRSRAAAGDRREASAWARVGNPAVSRFLGEYVAAVTHLDMTLGGAMRRSGERHRLPMQAVPTGEVRSPRLSRSDTALLAHGAWLLQTLPGRRDAERR